MELKEVFEPVALSGPQGDFDMTTGRPPVGKGEDDGRISANGYSHVLDITRDRWHAIAAGYRGAESYGGGGNLRRLAGAEPSPCGDPGVSGADSFSGGTRGIDRTACHAGVTGFCGERVSAGGPNGNISFLTPHLKRLSVPFAGEMRVAAS